MSLILIQNQQMSRVIKIFFPNLNKKPDSTIYGSMDFKKSKQAAVFMWFFHIIYTHYQALKDLIFGLCYPTPNPQQVFHSCAYMYPHESCKALFFSNASQHQTTPWQHLFLGLKNMILLAHCDWNTLCNLSSTSLFPGSMAGRLRKLVLFYYVVPLLYMVNWKIYSNCCTGSGIKIKIKNLASHICHPVQQINSEILRFKYNERIWKINFSLMY